MTLRPKSIRSKLTLLLLTEGAGMVFLLVVFGYLVRYSTRVLDGLDNRTRAQTETALRMVERAASMQDATLKLIRERDLDNVENLVKQSETLTLDLKDQIARMGSDGAAIAVAFEALAKADESVRASVMQGEGATAHTMFLEEATPAFQTLLARIRELQLELQKRNDAETEQVYSRVHTIQTLVVIVAVILITVIAIVGTLLTRSISNGLRKVVEKVRIASEGDLRVSLAAGDDESVDEEIRGLSSAFNEMVGNLRDLQGRVAAAFRELEQAVGDVNSLAGTLQSGSERQSRSVKEITELIAGTDEHAGGVVARMEIQTAKSEETSSSIVELIASIEEVSGNTDSLSSSVEETSSAIMQVLSSNKEVSRNLDSLNSLITNASASVAQIDRTIREVQSLAEESQRVSTHVKDFAIREGSTAISDAVGEMNKIRQAVVALSDTVHQLASSVSSIGDILVVIEHVAQQTNLLALNAAIIAAQAGEHGRGFAVVAEEIRALAERTTSSTQQITQVITGIQTETKNVGSLVNEGVSRVDGGVKAVNRTDQALKNIIANSEKALEMSSRMAEATREQARGSADVAASIGEVANRSAEIAHATAEQAEGSESIIRSVEDMRELAQHVRRAMGQQTTAARLISKASADSNQLTQDVTRASQQSKQLLERSVKEAHSINTSANETLSAVSRMKKLVETFGTLAAHLKATLSHFQT